MTRCSVWRAWPPGRRRAADLHLSGLLREHGGGEHLPYVFPYVFHDSTRTAMPARVGRPAHAALSVAARARHEGARLGVEHPVRRVVSPPSPDG
ncbi:hypothetical protein SBD_0207 [Streptomyces bottropensis ATCC 25435]|uniref:Uncharacterized protein n=1 Tax=Streptomyces bottropensis ATCC 25435 TaxID=1054862 RepID=M3FWW1_9ACTN|nr:hypothetical protein SBD_0207 [Streptomyces bottropensis ATCC 25435]